MSTDPTPPEDADRTDLHGNARENSPRKGEPAVLLALAIGQTVEAAAQAGGVDPSTVHRRLNEPAYRREVAAARGMLFRQALGKAADAMVEAVDTLRTLLRADNESVRLGAARTLVDVAIKLETVDELRARLESLEAMYNGLADRGLIDPTP